MSLKCGIVGLPNAGKSTLFNALTGNAVAAENYPFCTIEPNSGIAPLADARLDKLAQVARAARTVPAVVEFVDIAGLVKGAADNAGLGNRFLAHIRETDGIAHVVRCHEDADISHVHGQVNPADDIGVVNLELILADLATVEKALARSTRSAKSGDKEARARVAVAEKLQQHLAGGQPARTLHLSTSEQTFAQPLCLLTMKPALYIANVAEDGFADNPLLDAARQAAQADGAQVLPVCAQVEAEIGNWSAAEKAELLQTLAGGDAAEDTAAGGLVRIARAAFHMLNLITYFTAGEKEARAWTIRQGATAQEAAGVIHADFARGFIRAEVIDWADFAQYGGEAGAREAGKARQEGRGYVVADGDVMHFRFNV